MSTSWAPGRPQAHGRARRHAHALAGRLLDGLWHAVKAACRRLARAGDPAHTRATLALLNDATLRDIGLHRSHAEPGWGEVEGLVPLARRTGSARRHTARRGP